MDQPAASFLHFDVGWSVSFSSNAATFCPSHIIQHDFCHLMYFQSRPFIVRAAYIKMPNKPETVMKVTQGCENQSWNEPRHGLENKLVWSWNNNTDCKLEKNTSASTRGAEMKNEKWVKLRKKGWKNHKGGKWNQQRQKKIKNKTGNNTNRDRKCREKGCLVTTKWSAADLLGLSYTCISGVCREVWK